jgi:hypothetical protein
MTSFMDSLRPAHRRRRGANMVASPSDSASGRASKARRAKGRDETPLSPRTAARPAIDAGNSALLRGRRASARGIRSGCLVGIDAGPQQPSPKRHNNKQNQQSKGRTTQRPTPSRDLRPMLEPRWRARNPGRRSQVEPSLVPATLHSEKYSAPPQPWPMFAAIYRWPSRPTVPHCLRLHALRPEACGAGATRSTDAPAEQQNRTKRQH